MKKDLNDLLNKITLKIFPTHSFTPPNLDLISNKTCLNVMVFPGWLDLDRQYQKGFIYFFFSKPQNPECFQ